MMSVAIDTGPPLSAGLPERLFEGPYLNDLSRNYDVTRDGTRFLMVKGSASPAQTNIHVVLNWLEEHEGSVSVP